jgi:hypothetical protein
MLCIAAVGYVTRNREKDCLALQGVFDPFSPHTDRRPTFGFSGFLYIESLSYSIQYVFWKYFFLVFYYETWHLMK